MAGERAAHVGAASWVGGTAVVTGASRGIGRALAEALEDCGRRWSGRLVGARSTS